jgi:NUDIX domain
LRPRLLEAVGATLDTKCRFILRVPLQRYTEKCVLTQFLVRRFSAEFSCLILGLEFKTAFALCNRSNPARPAIPGQMRGEKTVTAAIIRSNDFVLLARRSAKDKLAGFWEFPGGKVEVGESPEQSLARELLEELGIVAQIGEKVTESLLSIRAR